ncbi:hypothetical protein C0993_005162 [Termitomyces sp. T159_Od127]|nr:hypothetical protein C0993_005162 [Termitomyces sp. T159_Od127]
MLTWQKYDVAVDMWSTGCVFAEMLEGKPLFPGKYPASYQPMFIFADVNQFSITAESLGTPPDDVVDTNSLKNAKGRPIIRPYTPNSSPDHRLQSIKLEVASSKSAKPLRVLSHFAIYEPKRGNEMVPLSSIEEDDGVDHQFVAEGIVFLYYQNDEDEGQEEDDENEGGNSCEPKLVKLSTISPLVKNYESGNASKCIDELKACISANPSHASIKFSLASHRKVAFDHSRDPLPNSLTRVRNVRNVV